MAAGRWALGGALLIAGASFAATMMPEDGGDIAGRATTMSGNSAVIVVPELRGNGMTVAFPALNGGKYAVRIASDATGSSAAYADQPVQLLTCSQQECDGSPTVRGNNANPSATMVQTPVGGGYDSVGWEDSSQNSVKAIANVTSRDGSVFSVVDVYSLGSGSATGLVGMKRVVTVVSEGGNDVGFNSKFLIRFASPLAQDQYRIFAPGIWYDHNSDARPGWFGQQSRDYTYWRETRSGLPLVAMQDPGSGATLSLAHVAPAPRTDGDNETRGDWVNSPTIRYGAMGIQKAGGTALGFTYPMQEVDTRPDNQTIGWTRRSNPVLANYTQSYDLLIGLKDDGDTAIAANFNAAMGNTWRTYYGIFSSGVGRVINTDEVVKAGISLLQRFTAPRFGAWGIAGKTSVRQGTLDDAPQYVMGYIGQQIPLGFQMFHYGIKNNNSDIRVLGARILDFWTAHADPTQGQRAQEVLPNTWWLTRTSQFDNGTCPSKPIFLRYVTDGMEGMATAAAFGHRNNFPHPTWERFSSNFADWLVTHQNTDGSWYRAYNTDGSPYSETANDPEVLNKTQPIQAQCIKVIDNADMADTDRNKLNTTHAIRFLVQMYEATGDPKYKTAIHKAAGFAFDNIYVPNRYVGGTTDTPNVTDREAGIIAMHAALALYDCDCDEGDGGADKRSRDVWLRQARRAANYTMTWAYAQNFAIRGAPPPYDQTGTLGTSLISASQSGADTALSLVSYDLYRLYLIDPTDLHLLTMARALESQTKYTTQITSQQQNFGFDYDGLLGEAASFWQLQWAPTGDSWSQWLPWLTNAQLDPLQRMQDRFGQTNIPAGTDAASAAMQAKNRSASPPAIAGWGT